MLFESMGYSVLFASSLLKLSNVLSICCEHLYSVVQSISNVYIPSAVKTNSKWIIELPIA
ncbi:hypothetical protein GBAR_LOCUS28102 [Geodia barretti]|uniref:Uncharacterized protein n=1 Tax=Geodia barretti TaxID=519541 RepID=A0AA35TQM9_GEOBA|nr:hypothetical protein GBAR_LOCUS28102 [Geodia barretti]